MLLLSAADPLSITRRRLISAGTVGAAGLSLMGCTGAAVRSASSAAPPAPSLCLPPVKVSRDRVIREIVGLRPYRASGFVVRAEALGAKRLVHNYGHGGAGITLSWGTSKLATQLGLQGHRGPVAVLGAGVMGLTTARLAQEAGFPVTVYAEALPPETTSNIAGGQWLATGHYDRGAVTEAWRAQFRSATDYAYRRFQLLVGDDYGVRWVTQYFETSPTPPGAAVPSRGYATQPNWRRLQRQEHPFPFDVRQHQLMMIEPGRFLRRLMQDVQIAGGKFVVRRLASPTEVAALPETLVFNCTGLGARELFGDKDLYPIRGQLVILLPQPEIDYALGFQSHGGGYMFPRSDGIVLGGTHDENEWSTTPDPAVTDRIIVSHQQVFRTLRCRPSGLTSA